MCEINVKEMYEKSKEFKEYVDRFAVAYKMDTETALSQKIVKETAKYYDTKIKEPAKR
ncbi:MAG: hypothetical protein IKA36_01910 [Clostridia bacterium]|nr:hypothetical protein [Clostridia bacterium]